MTHDQTMPAPVEVTQADREAAQALMDRWEFGDLHCDDFVEAFARHRIAHSAPAGEVEPVAWMYDGGGSAYAVFVTRSDWRVRAGWTETPLYTHPAPPADLVGALTNVRAQNAADMKRSGAVWEAYDRAVLDCIAALSEALAKHGGA